MGLVAQTWLLHLETLEGHSRTSPTQAPAKASVGYTCYVQRCPCHIPSTLCQLSNERRGNWVPKGTQSKALARAN